MNITDIEKLIEIQEEAETLFRNLYKGKLPEQFTKAYTHLTKSKMYLNEVYNNLCKQQPNGDGNVGIEFGK